MSNEEKPFSYLIHKVLNILQSNATPLRRKEIHSLLYKDGVQISLESDFWTKIHLHDRVFLDQATGKYSYKSPYDKLNSEISLLAFVRQHQDGLLIDEELLKVSTLKIESNFRVNCRILLIINFILDKSQHGEMDSKLNVQKSS